LAFLRSEWPVQMGWQHVRANVVAYAEACDFLADGEDCPGGVGAGDYGEGEGERVSALEMRSVVGGDFDGRGEWTFTIGIVISR
jgi:hypothetical protein